MVNLDLPENKHFVQDFEITFNTVVLAELRDGKPARWKNLSAVWDVSQAETAFKNYLEGESTAFLVRPSDIFSQKSLDAGRAGVYYFAT